MSLVRLLGPVDVVGEDGTVYHSASALRRALLALLGLHAARVLSSDWLLEQVWGDEQPDSGLPALRFHISQLRKEVGEAVSIVTHPGGYQLDASRTSVDALIFDDQAHEARAEDDDVQASALCRSALALWRGAPFGGAAACATLDNEAARLEEVRLAIIEHHQTRRLGSGAGSELIADLSQLVKEHPLRESLWSSLIVAQYRSGQQAEALRSYERLRHNLAESLGLDPSPELQDLQMRVLCHDPELVPGRAHLASSARAASAPGQAGADQGLDALRLPPSLELAAESGPLVGRVEELQQLRDLWDRVSAGRSLVAVVTGEAGVGKSRLVAELALEVHGGGGAVLLGSCFEDAQTPYHPFAQAIGGSLDGLNDAEVRNRLGADVRTLGVLLPSLLGRPETAEIIDGSAERAELLAAIDRYLFGLASVSPTLLVVEDVHWATSTTRDALLHLARAAGRAPLLVVATSRDTSPDVSDVLTMLLGDLARQPNAERLSLRGLDNDGVRDLVAAADGDFAAVDVRAISEQTGGNPLFVRELLASRQWHSPVGTSVQGLLSLRSQRLDRDDNELLDLAATIGAEFDADLLAAAGDVQPVDVLAALERAESAGLTIGMPGRPGRFAFVHALFRSVRYDSLPTSRRPRLHHQVAQALEVRHGAGDAVVAQLARHAFAAIPLGDLKAAIDYSRRAGDIAMESIALDEGADHYRRALDVADLLQPPDEDLRGQLAAKLGHALIELDDPRARPLLEQAADAARRRGDYDLLADVIWLMYGYGLVPGRHDPLVVALCHDALAGVGQQPTAARARLLMVLATYSSGSDHPDRRIALFDEALATARSSDDPVATGQVLSALQVTGWHPDNLTERVAATDELVALADRLNHPIFRILAHGAAFSNLLETGEIAAARAESIAIERLVGERQDTFAQLGIHSRRATNLFLAGDLDAAEQTAEQILRLGTAVAPSRRIDPLAYFYGPHLIVIRFNQGRIGELIPLIRAADESSSELDAYQAVLAMALARTGELDAARTILRRLTDDQIAAVRRHLQWFTAMMCLADAAELTGEVDIARLLADQLDPYSGRLAEHGTGVSQPIDLALAQLALATGDLDRAALKATRTAESSRRNNTPIFLARSLLQQAAVQLRIGDSRQQFESFIDEALSIARGTGAALIAQDAARYGLT
jgi:DNA-binding SARP family transcriptional activator/tetratricopeptide (TPR) repeat protein/Mrp family chromosome partitioning ATPase